MDIEMKRSNFTCQMSWALILGSLLNLTARADSIAKTNVPAFALTPAFADDFLPGWETNQCSWRIATWKQNGTAMSLERCRTDGQGMLVQTVLPGEPSRGGSLQTNREFPYGRWVARLKPSSVPGVNNSMFTKDWDDLTTPNDEHDGNKAEVDIEFLTSTFGTGRGKVHLAIHLKDKPRFFEKEADLNFNPSDAFHVWGFDVLPDRVVWHVDGKELHTWMIPPGITIEPAYEFFFNSWTMVKWIEGPPKEAAQYLIDWVKFYPLTKP
jgi:beta-glucanase (GH16 family)